MRGHVDTIATFYSEPVALSPENGDLLFTHTHVSLFPRSKRNGYTRLLSGLHFSRRQSRPFLTARENSIAKRSSLVSTANPAADSTLAPRFIVRPTKNADTTETCCKGETAGIFFPRSTLIISIQ